MIRNLKALGLAFVAVLALGAVAASGAQAEKPAHFTAEAGTTTIKGTGETAISHQVFTTTAGKVECEGHFTNRGAFNLTDTQLTMNAEYTGCTPFFGAEPKVSMGSCHYTFTAGTYGPAGTSVGSVHLVCANETEPITITAPGCTVTVKGPQTLSKVHYQTKTNATTGKTDVTVSPEVSNIAYSHTGFLCGTGSGTTGTYTGPATIEGFNEKGKATNISITST